MLFLELDTIETLPAFPASNHVFSGSKTRVFTVAHRAHGLGLEMHMGTNMQPCEAREHQAFGEGWRGAEQTGGGPKMGTTHIYAGARGSQKSRSPEPNVSLLKAGKHF